MAYAFCIAIKALVPSPHVPSPRDFGWKEATDGLEIVWMTKKPAPESILDLISCSCKKRKCTTTNSCETFYLEGTSNSERKCCSTHRILNKLWYETLFKYAEIPLNMLKYA